MAANNNTTTTDNKMTLSNAQTVDNSDTLSNATTTPSWLETTAHVDHAERLTQHAVGSFGYWSQVADSLDNDVSWCLDSLISARAPSFVLRAYNLNCKRQIEANCCPVVAAIEAVEAWELS